MDGIDSSCRAILCVTLTPLPYSFQASNDPWEMARSGMVNIDDITDTKNKPKVEVKPFTNDHRPLADLVREAPVKVRCFRLLCSTL